MLIDQDVPGTVHRLEPEALALDLDRPEHPVREVLEVTRDLVELFVHDVRRDHRLVAALGETFADEVLDDAADERRPWDARRPGRRRRPLRSSTGPSSGPSLR